MDKNFTGILDNVLKAIVENENSADANMPIILSKESYNITDRELIEIKKKLVKDEYAYFEGNEIKPTLEGMEFCCSGGYKNEIKTNQTKLKIELRKSNILFVGSVLAGLYALMRIVQSIYHHICR